MYRRLRPRLVHFFGYLRKEKQCVMPNSDFFCGRNTFFLGKSSLRSVSTSRQNWKFSNYIRYEIGTTNALRCQVPI